MAPLPWQQFTERMVGRGHPTLADTNNRALRALLSGSGYDPDAATFPGLPGPVVNGKALGVMADGTTDDTPALIAAFQAINTMGGGTLWLPPGTINMGSNPFATVTSLLPCRVMGSGMQATVLKKGFNGSWLTFPINFGNFIRWEHLTFDGQHDAGRTGTGFVYTGTAGGAGNDYHSFFRVRFLGIESHFLIGSNAAYGLSFLDCEAYPSAAQQGTGEYAFFAPSADDTFGNARHRRFTNCLFALGTVDISGMQDVYMATCGIKRLHTSSTSAEYYISASLLGNSDASHPLSGQGTVTACRCAGDVVIDSSFAGAFVGNFQTAGTFTDNTASAGSATVLHHPLSVNWALLDHLRFSATKNPEEVQTFRISTDFGDASPAQQALDQGPTLMWFNTPLTANRNVTLPAVTGNRDGKTIRVLRTKAATGVSTLTVDSSPNVVLAVGTWADFTRNGNTSVWTPSAGGTLP